MGASATPSIGSASTTIVRALALLAFGAALVLLPESVEAPGAADLMPDIVTLVFIQLVPVIFSRRRDLFAPPIYAGLLGALSAIAIGAYLAKVGPSSLIVGRGDPEAQIRLARMSLWVLGVGAISYQLGYYLRRRPGLARRFPDVAGLVWNRHRLLVTSAVILVAAALAYAAFQLRLGVPLTELTHLREGRTVLAEDRSQTWLTRGIQLGFLPALLLLAHTFRHARRPRAMLIALLLSAITAALVFRTALRGTVAQVLILSTLLFHYLRHRIGVGAFVALYLAGIGVANVALQWRAIGGESDRELTWGSVLANPLDTMAEHESDRTRLDAIAVIVDYFPDRHEYLYGASYLAFLAVPIPRWIWPEKRDFSPWADNAIPERIIGLLAPPALPAVLYANFSWIGIFIGMFLFGMFQRGLYDWFQQAPRDPSVVLLYGATLLFFTPTLLGVSFTLQYVLPLWLILRFIGRRSPREPVMPSSAVPIQP